MFMYVNFRNKLAIQFQTWQLISEANVSFHHSNLPNNSRVNLISVSLYLEALPRVGRQLRSSQIEGNTLTRGCQPQHFTCSHRYPVVSPDLFMKVQTHPPLEFRLLERRNPNRESTRKFSTKLRKNNILIRKDFRFEEFVRYSLLINHFSDCERRRTIMVAEAELVCQQRVPLLDVQFFPKGINIHEIEEAPVVSPSLKPTSFDRVRSSELVSAELLNSQEVSSSGTLFFWFSIPLFFYPF